MNFKRNKVYKFIQDRKRKSKNKVAVQCLLELGFSATEVRRGLMKMNGVSAADLLQANPGLKPPTLYSTIHGRRLNPIAKQVTAKALGLDVEDLYPQGKALPR